MKWMVPNRFDWILLACTLPFFVVNVGYYFGISTFAAGGRAEVVPFLAIVLGVTCPLLSAAIHSRLGHLERTLVLLAGLGGLAWLVCVGYVPQATLGGVTLHQATEKFDFDYAHGWNPALTAFGFAGLVLATGCIWSPAVRGMRKSRLAPSMNRTRWLIALAAGMYLFAAGLNWFGGIRTIDSYYLMASDQPNSTWIWLTNSFLLSVFLVHIPCELVWQSRSFFRAVGIYAVYLIAVVLFLAIAPVFQSPQAVICFSAFVVGQVAVLWLLFRREPNMEPDGGATAATVGFWPAVARMSPFFVNLLFVGYWIHNSDAQMSLRSRSWQDLQLARHMMQFYYNSGAAITKSKFRLPAPPGPLSFDVDVDLSFHATHLTGLSKVASVVDLVKVSGVRANRVDLREMLPLKMIHLVDGDLGWPLAIDLLDGKGTFIIENVSVNGMEPVKPRAITIGGLEIRQQHQSWSAQWLKLLTDDSTIGSLLIRGEVGPDNFREIVRLKEKFPTAIFATDLLFDDKLVQHLATDSRGLRFHCDWRSFDSILNAFLISDRTQIKVIPSVRVGFGSSISSNVQRVKAGTHSLVDLWKTWLKDMNPDSWPWFEKALIQVEMYDAPNEILDLAEQAGWIFSRNEHGDELGVWFPSEHFVRLLTNDELARIDVLGVGPHWLGMPPDTEFWGELSWPRDSSIECRSISISGGNIPWETIKRSPQLEELQLLGDLWSASYFSIAIKSAPNLRKLGLSWPIRGNIAGYPEFAQLDEITLIDNANARVSTADLQALQSAFPKVKFTVIDESDCERLAPPEFLEHLEKIRSDRKK